MPLNIGIVGAGYVGLVTGACLSDIGHNVTCIDTDKKKIDLINKKITPIYEKELASLLKKNKILATNRYEKSISNKDVIFICVGTPSLECGSQDLSYIKKTCKEIGKNLENETTIVMKSSVLPGTTEEIVTPLIEKHSKLVAGKDFSILVNPEFLREGNAVYDFKNPNRIIIGHNGGNGKKILTELYQGFDCPKIYTSLRAAEMIKYASNAFLSTKISFINEIGNLCKKLNIDVYEVANGMGHDPRIGPYFLNAGIGWGGSCFPKDTLALIEKGKALGIDLKIIENAVKVNDLQPLKIIELLKKHIKNISGKEIGVLGLSFKPDTDDIRDSRSIPIISKLIEENAKIKAYDPKAIENFKKLFPTIKYCKPEEVLDSDAILILTDWKEFEELDYKDKIVIDGRRIQKARNKSRIYEGVCW